MDSRTVRGRVWREQKIRRDQVISFFERSLLRSGEKGKNRKVGGGKGISARREVNAEKLIHLGGIGIYFLKGAHLSKEEEKKTRRPLERGKDSGGV